MYTTKAVIAAAGGRHRNRKDRAKEATRRPANRLAAYALACWKHRQIDPALAIVTLTPCPYTPSSAAPVMM